MESFVDRTVRRALKHARNLSCETGYCLTFRTRRSEQPRQELAGEQREALERHPAALWSVVELLASRLRAVDEALADTVFLDVPGRTAKRLLELAGEGDQFQLPVTQEELAAMVGASRERVNKAISQFVRLGWLEQQDRVYRIVNREQLTRRAR